MDSLLAGRKFLSGLKSDDNKKAWFSSLSLSPFFCQKDMIIINNYVVKEVKEDIFCDPHTVKGLKHNTFAPVFFAIQACGGR